MTRKEQLAFCKICTNQKFHSQQGIICGLTDARADFEGSCQHFEEDKAKVSEYEKREERDAWYSNMASPGSRFVNYLLDSICIMIAFWAVFFILFLLNEETPIQILDLVGAESGVAFIYLLYFLVFFGYYFGLEALTGRTVGKAITRTIVVSEDGKKADVSKIMVRNLCRFIPLEVFSFLGNGIGWHDTLSKTRVVYLPKN